MGDKSYFSQDNHVNQKVYESQIKPLIQKFLDENKEVLKSLLEGNLFKSFGAIEESKSTFEVLGVIR